MNARHIIPFALALLATGAQAQQQPEAAPAAVEQPAKPAFPPADGIAARPRLQADGNRYMVSGTITQVVDGVIVIQRMSAAEEKFFGRYFVSNTGGNWTAVLRLTGRAGDHIRRTASIGSHVQVIGRYSTNMAFNMANGERATFAAFDTVEIVQGQ